MRLPLEIVIIMIINWLVACLFFLGGIENGLLCLLFASVFNLTWYTIEKV